MDEPPLNQAPYSSIHRCQLNHTFEKFIMKQLRRGYMRKVDREAYLNSMREIDIHKQLKHPHVVELRTVIDDQQDDKVYLVMEEAGGGQLMNELVSDDGQCMFKPSRSGPNFLSESEIRTYTQQFASALHYMHSKKIMHLDLKPQNVLLSSTNQVKLADFGSSQ